MRVWIGVIIYAVWVGGTYIRIRRRRRSGEIRDFGHPVLDQLLLLGSGLMLAALLLVAMFLFRGADTRSLTERVFVYAALIAGGGVLTWLCNALLRGTRG